MTAVLRHPRLREAAAIGAVLLASAATTWPWSLRGFNLSDQSWPFHFGRRLLAGEWPYRDYVFQTGPLPVLLDAGFQTAFGPAYLSALLAAFAVKTAALLALYGLFRAGSGRAVSAALSAGFGCLMPLVCHSAYYHADLFLIAAAGCFVWAERLAPRAAGLHFAAGLMLAGLVGSRQSTAVFCIPLALAAAARFAAEPGSRAARTLLLPLAGGLAAGTAALAGLLAAHGALADAVAQMFLDAPQKKMIAPAEAVADAVFGGFSLGDAGVTQPEDLLRYNAVPLLWAAAAVAVAWAVCRFAGRRGADGGGSRFPAAVLTLSAAGAVVGLLPDAVAPLNALGLHLGAGSWGPFAERFTYDIPRWTAALALPAAVFPPTTAWFRRACDRLGLPAGATALTAALVVGYVWALQVSQPERAYVTLAWRANPLTLLAAVAASALSQRLTGRVKAWLAAAVLTAAAAPLMLHLAAGTLVVRMNPAGMSAACTEPAGSPLLAGVRLPREKAFALDRLAAAVRPGDGLFVYGSAPALYTLLGARNPTRLDVIFADFFTPADAARAAADLRADPPEWILQTGDYCDLRRPYDPDRMRGIALRHQGLPILHEALHELSADYELVAHLEAEYTTAGAAITEDCDSVLDWRLYRRTRRPTGTRDAE
jgi:hypothetical protein